MCLVLIENAGGGGGKQHSNTLEHTRRTLAHTHPQAPTGTHRHPHAPTLTLWRRARTCLSVHPPTHALKSPTIHARTHARMYARPPARPHISAEHSVYACNLPAHRLCGAEQCPSHRLSGAELFCGGYLMMCLYRHNTAAMPGLRLGLLPKVLRKLSYAHTHTHACACKRAHVRACKMAQYRGLWKW